MRELMRELMMELIKELIMKLMRELIGRRTPCIVYTAKNDNFHQISPNINLISVRLIIRIVK